MKLAFLRHSRVQKKFENLFDGPARTPDTKLTQREMDLAASIQKVAEEVILKIAKTINTETKQKKRRRYMYA